MAEYNKIFLIGFMGSGKSTAGKKLALALGWSFTDMDAKIEASAGQSIPEIFSMKGEAYFREIECRVLREFGSANHIVVSTGGGVPCHGDNMRFMKETGLTIYLKLTPLQLKNRLSEAKGERPLIKGLKDDDLLKFIQNKLSQRESYYSQASLTIDGYNIDYKNLIGLINSLMTTHPPLTSGEGERGGEAL